MTDINRELAEDAALDYSDDPVVQMYFASGWLTFCDGKNLEDCAGEGEEWHHFRKGYIAARDAPE